ncbi:T9SS type A sorting domain-containing protein [Candidatus Acetothermia bacterium]|nr:T9SS type A sorting domain-containing protein [Candidatus Acetothermia bacterium]
MKNSTIKVASMMVVAALVLIAGVVAVAPAALASKGSIQFTDVNGTPKIFWRVGDTAFITVIDQDENRNSGEAELLGGTVLMDGPAKGSPVVEVWVGSLDRVLDHETLTLQETGNNTGVFRSQTGLKIAPAGGGQFTPNNGTLEVMNGYTVLARYQDPTDPTDISIDLAKIERTAGKVSFTDAAGNPINQVLDVGNSVYVTLEDPDKNTDPNTPDQIDNAVTLLNPRTSQSLPISLTETDKNSGVFRNTEGVVLYDLKGPANPGSNSLEVDDKDTIVAFYRAPVTGGGVGPSTGCKTDNSAITFERALSASVKPGDTFAVKDTITAKQNVRALIVSDDVNGFSALDPTKAGSITPLASGQSFTFTYRVKAGSNEGTYHISGKAIAITDGTTQAPLTLDCSVKVSKTSASLRVKPLADVNSNTMIEVKRDVPAQVGVGQTFTVKVTITAKQKIRAFILNDDVGGLKALDPTKVGSITSLDAGQSFNFSYRAQCATAGTFTINGKATPVADGTPGDPVSVSSTVTCGGGGGGGGGTPGPSAGNLGDPNDPSDFALAMAKIAEPNPSTVEFTDVAGKPKAEYRIGEDVFVTVKDKDANSDSDRVNTVTVSVYAPYGGGRERVTLVETGTNTGEFRNPDSVKLVPAKNDAGDNDGKLGTYNGGTLYVEYRDIAQEGEISQRQDLFDTTYATAKVASTLAFSVTPSGQKTVAIRFTDDAGKTIDPYNGYKVGQDVFVEVTDLDANMTSDLVETVQATVLNRDTMDMETITLWETGPNSGVFSNKQGLPLRRPGEPSGCTDVCKNDGNLQMEDRDFIEAHYQDANNPMDYAATIVNIIPERMPCDPNDPTCSHPTKGSKTQFTDASGKALDAINVDATKTYVTVKDDSNTGKGKLDNALTVTLWRGGSAVKSTKVSLNETAAKNGTFLSDPITLGSGQTLEIQEGDTLKAEYVDPNDSSDKSSDMKPVKKGSPPQGFKCDGVQTTVNSSGKITFKVLGSGIVNTQVTVYDVTGRQVWSGSKASDTLDWNGLSANGGKLANGVYLYVVICKGEKQSDIKTLSVKKLVILK